MNLRRWRALKTSDSMKKIYDRRQFASPVPRIGGGYFSGNAASHQVSESSSEVHVVIKSHSILSLFLLRKRKRQRDTNERVEHESVQFFYRRDQCIKTNVNRCTMDDRFPWEQNRSRSQLLNTDQIWKKKKMTQWSCSLKRESEKETYKERDKLTITMWAVGIWKKKLRVVELSNLYVVIFRLNIIKHMRTPESDVDTLERNINHDIIKRLVVKRWWRISMIRKKNLDTWSYERRKHDDVSDKVNVRRYRVLNNKNAHE